MTIDWLLKVATVAFSGALFPFPTFCFFLTKSLGGAAFLGLFLVMTIRYHVGLSTLYKKSTPVAFCACARASARNGRGRPTTNVQEVQVLVHSAAPGSTVDSVNRGEAEPRI